MLTFDEARLRLNAALVPLQIQLSPVNRSRIHIAIETIDWGKTAQLHAQSRAFRLMAIRKYRIFVKQGRTGCHGPDGQVLAFCSAVLQSVAEYRIHNGMG